MASRLPETEPLKRILASRKITTVQTPLIHPHFAVETLPHQATPNVIKTFCQNCGSSLATIYPWRDNLLGLPVAGCEGELDDYQEFHIYTGSKAKWWRITDNLPQYENMPEDKTIVHCIDE